jgi:hypothetical protein
MKLGKGWAPESKPDTIELKAIEELKALLKTIFEFNTKHNLLRGK